MYKVGDTITLDNGTTGEVKQVKLVGGETYYVVGRFWGQAKSEKDSDYSEKKTIKKRKIKKKD